MVRISDILKQQGKFPEPEPRKDKKQEKPASISSEKTKLPEQEPERYSEKTEDKTAEGIQFSKAISQEESEAEKEMQLVKAMHQMQLDPLDSVKIYKRGLENIKQILTQIKSNAPLDLRETYEIIKTVVDRIVLGDKELLSLINNYSQDNYLYAHSVNVCILAIELGLGLGYNKSRLNELGLGAFLHDVGMIKVIDIANLGRPLSEFEYQEIKRHPVYSTDILNKVKDIQEGVMLVCGQTHERLDGRGYPEGLKSERISEYARITAVVDVYEALIHPRSHRKAMMPHDALRELLNIGGTLALDTTIIKILINKIGLYPVGSWVELNTDEIAKVISSNEDSPLRPKVNIIFGVNKEKLSQIKLLDLSAHVNVYIKRNVNPQDLILNL
jgi:HD-GYP domain-containing protein (c-di-GMP phosphodiesterase class II)